MERNVAYVSKWLRKSIKQYENFEMSMEGLKSFIIDAKVPFLIFFVIIFLNFKSVDEQILTY